MAKRTLESFYKPISKPKKPRSEDTPSSYSHHPSYPFPIADLPPTIANALPNLPATTPRSITNQPHLDLLYYRPFIPSPTAHELFHFLRRELPFYRVQYTIRRGPTATQITTPRFTTVFGVDDTSLFTSSANDSTPVDSHNDCHLVDSKTHSPVPSTKYKSTPRPIPPCLDALRRRVEAATDGARYNFCLVNYYATGDDSIAYHSDDERFLGSNPCIASLSLGAKRDFLMKHKLTEGVEAAPVKMALADGDMVVMRGDTQANWLHSVPKRKGGEARQGRINITFRRAVVPAGTENYYRYNVGEGKVYRWSEEEGRMEKADANVEWMPGMFCKANQDVATAASELYGPPRQGYAVSMEYPAQADYIYVSTLPGSDRAGSMASSLPIYSLQDVSRHNTAKDLWIVIDGEVFDVTQFQAEHPGGEKILRKVAGKDATDKFLEYHGASTLSRYRERLQVGVLKEETKAQEPTKGFFRRFFGS